MRSIWRIANKILCGTEVLLLALRAPDRREIPGVGVGQNRASARPALLCAHCRSLTPCRIVSATPVFRWDSSSHTLFGAFARAPAIVHVLTGGTATLARRNSKSFGGARRNRTADKGFADLCLTTWRPRPLRTHSNCDECIFDVLPLKRQPSSDGSERPSDNWTQQFVRNARGNVTPDDDAGYRPTQKRYQQKPVE